MRYEITKKDIDRGFAYIDGIMDALYWKLKVILLEAIEDDHR